MVYAKPIDFLTNFLINVDGCSNKRLKHKQLVKGDEFTINHKCGDDYKVGSKYQLFDNLMVVEVVYAPKKWWRFWGKRKVLGYVVRCIKD